MTEEELRKDYYADRPSEPYSDDDRPSDWANIAHYAEENLENAFKRIEELGKENAELKEARDYVLEWGDKTDGTYACCRDGYLAGAEPREKRIAELEAQVEKMKCCGNCRYFDRDEPKYCDKGVFNAYICDKWRFAND